MLKMDQEKKSEIQEAFRYFKSHPKLPHVEVQDKLVHLLGKDFVSHAWKEARRLLEGGGGSGGGGAFSSPEQGSREQGGISRQQQQQQQQQMAARHQQHPQQMVVEMLDDLDLVNAHQATGNDIETDITREADLESIVREEDEGLLEHLQAMRMLSSAEAEKWENKHVMDGELCRKALARAERKEGERLAALAIGGMGAGKKRVGKEEGGEEEEELVEEEEEEEDPGRKWAVEALSRACQDYATGLLEDLVRIARERENEDVRHLIREGATLGAGEPMVVKFLQPYKMPWACGALAGDEQQQQQQMQQQQQLQQQGQTRGLRAEGPHVLRRADVVRNGNLRT